MSDIKKFFHTRFENGLLVEMDFSQLEVIALAIVSADPILVDDLKSGKDMHTVRAAELFRIPESRVTPAQRKLAKAFSFQLQYGAGAGSMAAKNGTSVEVAKEFIENYYKRYSVLKNYQEDLRKTIEYAKKPMKEHTKKGYPRHVSKFYSATGRIYTFKTYDAPEWSRSETNFSPTEIKNYPIQGFATGDVMAVYRASIYRRLLREDLLEKILLINSVHDSVMFDLVDSYYPLLVNICEEEAAKLPAHLERIWGIDCLGLSFPIDFKKGPTWAEMK